VKGSSSDVFGDQDDRLLRIDEAARLLGLTSGARVTKGGENMQDFLQVIVGFDDVTAVTASCDEGH
jgi:hypothetical protein